MKRDIVKYLIFLILPVATILAVGYYAYAWFSVSNVTNTPSYELEVFSPPPVYLAYSDSAFYKNGVAPARSDTPIFLTPYDYDDLGSNSQNDLFILLEVELVDSTTTNFSLKVKAEAEEPVMSKIYRQCSQPNVISNVRGAPEYVVDGQNYAVYYYDENLSQYVRCSDYSLVTAVGSGWTYNGKGCMYSTYYLSDCVTVEFLTPTISAISELNNKTSAGNLANFTGFYNTLSSYFESGSPSSGTFVNSSGTQWTKTTELSFNGTFSAQNTKTIGGKSYSYLAIRLSYNDAVMQNENANYKFIKTANQLFYSDIRFVLE